MNPNDIKKDDIPTTAEEMAAWEEKYGTATGGVDDRFDHNESKCFKPENAEADEALKENVVRQLTTIYDPELPVDIYNLGLIYDIDCWTNPTTKLGECKVVMTLTSATCSMSEVIVDLVRSIPARLDGLECMDVELVFDPPWSQEKMSDEAKLTMGLL